MPTKKNKADVRRVKRWEVVNFNKGELCLRCGSSKKDNQGCSHWGQYFARHLWNTTTMKVKTYYIKIK